MLFSGVALVVGVPALTLLGWTRVSACRFLSISRPQRNSTFFFREPQRQRPAPDDTSERAHWSEFAFQQNQHIPTAWPSLFEAELGSLPEELTSPCCGQFAVSRQRVLAHPKSFYQVIAGPS